MQVVHRDLKPGNIVLDAKHHIKLIDFATCKVFNKEIAAKIAAFRSKNDLMKTMGFGDDNDLDRSTKDARVYSLVGTEEYLAPETINGHDLSYACDYWSLGIILYQLLCGVTPFKGRSELETYQNIQKCDELVFKKSNVDPLAKDLIHRLLIKEPTMRIGYDDISEIKEHPFFKDTNWDTLRETQVPVQVPMQRRPQRLQNFSNSFSEAKG